LKRTPLTFTPDLVGAEHKEPAFITLLEPLGFNGTALIDINNVEKNSANIIVAIR
jgi:hypothetical protein